jgi:hypothetical protein
MQKLTTVSISTLYSVDWSDDKHIEKDLEGKRGCVIKLRVLHRIVDGRKRKEMTGVEFHNSYSSRKYINFMKSMKSR